MKILLWSNAFYPAIGGLEEFARMMATEFSSQGHSVTVITNTIEQDSREFPFVVVRRPKPTVLFGLVRQCDVYFQNHISLRTAWPLLFLNRPWFVLSQTWLSTTTLLGKIKHFTMRFAHPVSCSNEIASHLRVPSAVINNCYDDAVFCNTQAPRDKDLIFVGRLAPEKGIPILIDALRLVQHVYPARLTIIGEGALKTELVSYAHDSGVSHLIDFLGSQTPGNINEFLNRHRVLVVPSLYREPFGIVALEGIASGCIVVGSEGGGLKDAIGPCGMTFPNGNSVELAKRLEQLLLGHNLAAYRAGAPAHLKRFTKEAVAGSYLRIFAAALSGEVDPISAADK
jgi:glycosyltransferase involved in cell wall biosynthesis